MSTAEAVDDKAGYCSTCRAGTHSLCASPTCRCSKRGLQHPNRPKATAGTVSTMPTRDTVGGRAKPDQPVWELVKADPPPATPKRSATDQVRVLLEQLVAAGDHDWHRLAVFPKRTQAAMIGGRCKSHFSQKEWEFQWSRNDDTGQSALYARWTGTNGAL